MHISYTKVRKLHWNYIVKVLSQYCHIFYTIDLIRTGLRGIPLYIYIQNCESRQHMLPHLNMDFVSSRLHLLYSTVYKFIQNKTLLRVLQILSMIIMRLLTCICTDNMTYSLHVFYLLRST